jgi:hypothetical protein
VATRRKPRGYKDGGAVIADVVAPPEPAPVEAAPVSPAPSSPAAPPPSADDDPLIRALRAQTRAEELQRQAAKPPQTIEQHIDGLPISDHKKAFLKARPELLQPEKARALASHYHAGLAAGLADDSPELDRAILRGLALEGQAVVDGLRSAAKPMPARIEQEGADLAPAPIAPRKPSVRVSAPVSREAPMPSGKRREDTTVTLTPEEVDMAHRSIIDRPDMPKMSNAEKEYSYWLQKKKYLAMKASGEYSEQRE